MPDPSSLKRDLDALRISRPGSRAPAPPPPSFGEEALPAPPREAEERGFAAPAAARRVRPKRTGLVLLVVLALAAAAALALYAKYARVFSAPEVAVARVVARDAATRTVVLTMAGYVVADRKATVGPQVAGRLMQLAVDEGDTVEAGQVLARLNDAWYVAQVKSIEARLENARIQADRAKRLVDTGSGPPDAYDRARTAQDEISAELEQAREELDFTVIRAPISGLVIRRDADLGELVTPGGGPGQIKTAILSLVDPSTFEVEVDVNETDIAKVELGSAGDVVLDAYPGKKYPGVVRKIAPIANRQKGTIQVKVRFQRVDADVRPEMSARVSLFERSAGPRGEEAPAAAGSGRRLFGPTEALLGEAGAKIVYVVDGEGRARRRDVSVGGLADGLAEVVSGLAAGENVVVSGHALFGDGDPVSIAGR